MILCITFQYYEIDKLVKHTIKGLIFTFTIAYMKSYKVAVTQESKFYMLLQLLKIL